MATDFNNNPSRVAVDRYGNVYIAYTANNAVNEILAVNGSIPFNAPTIVALGTGFNAPGGVAVDASGDVFVADTGNSAVKEIVAVNGSIPASPTINTLGSGFSTPQGVAVDSKGDVFVADSGTPGSENSSVKEMVAVSGSIPASPTINNLAGHFFQSPYGVAVDNNGNVFVADEGYFGPGGVGEIHAVSGSVPANPTITWVNFSYGFTGPGGVAVDSSGDLFVADTNNNAVEEFLAVSGSLPATPTFNLLGGSFTANETLSDPTGVAVDGSGNVFVSVFAYNGYGTNSVEELGIRGVNGVSFGSSAVGAASAPASIPFTIAASSATTVGSIGILTQGLPNMSLIDGGGSTCAAGTYTTATACVVNVSFTPVSAGMQRGAVVFYDGSGNILYQVPLYGIGAGPQVVYQGAAQTTLATGLNSPNGLTVDAAGNVYIADDKRILRVTPGGTQTTVASGLLGAEGVAIDGAGSLFFADYAGVYKVSPTGAANRIYYDEWDTVTGIAFDGPGNLWIAAVSNSGTNSPLVTITPSGAQSTVGGFFEPVGIAADASGTVYVADPGCNCFFKVMPARRWPEPLPIRRPPERCCSPVRAHFPSHSRQPIQPTTAAPRQPFRCQ